MVSTFFDLAGKPQGAQKVPRDPSVEWEELVKLKPPGPPSGGRGEREWMKAKAVSPGMARGAESTGWPLHRCFKRRW